MKGAIAALFLLGVAGAHAACENACSGHGSCTADNVCLCHSDWQMGDEASGDCSDRVCPFETAWVDAPNNSGLTHNYQECAGKGLCDRETGACECFEGYEGKACQRTACPNDCSGHGTCEYLEELTYGNVHGDYFDGSSNSLKGLGTDAHNDVTATWDSHKSRACVCDPQYTDVDCSRRQCPRGNDVMHERTDRSDTQLHQVQAITLYAAGENGNGNNSTVFEMADQSFALTFTSTIGEAYTTVPILISETAASTAGLGADIASALTGLPNNVIDGVTVTIATGAGSDITPASITASVTFTGEAVEGTQNLLEVEIDACGAGCTPQLTGLELTSVGFDSFVAETQTSDYNNHECGRRGKCDFDSGLCECFTGYTGLNCNQQTALI